LAKQSFVTAKDLKTGLRELADTWDALTPEARARRSFALGSYPWATGTGSIDRLWKTHMGAWPGSGNNAIKLDPEEAHLAMNEARALVDSETDLARGV